MSQETCRRIHTAEAICGQKEARNIMAAENGQWIMYGMAWDDPYRIRSHQELIRWVQEIGFLPLFKNEADGFSAEEHTSNQFWWTGDPEQDPWAWRELIARSGEVAYGKFFGGKAGFISREWFPCFANYRRDGYDFDARWDDELANIRCKKIMDCFDREPEIPSHELKLKAGFGKGGEKNFSGILTQLQMQSYLTIRDFRRRVSKKGQTYGMAVAVYAQPEQLWGYDHVTSAYREDPQESWERIWDHVRPRFSAASEEQLRKVLR